MQCRKLWNRRQVQALSLIHILFSNSPRIALFENAKIPDVRERLVSIEGLKEIYADAKGVLHDAHTAALREIASHADLRALDDVSETLILVASSMVLKMCIRDRFWIILFKTILSKLYHWKIYVVGLSLIHILPPGLSNRDGAQIRQ